MSLIFVAKCIVWARVALTRLHGCKVAKRKKLTPPIQNMGRIQLSYKLYHTLFVVTQIA